MRILLSPDEAATAAASSGTGEDLFEGGQGAATTDTTSTQATTTSAGAGTTEGAGAQPAAATATATTGLSKDDLQQILTGALEHVGTKATAAAATSQPERQYSQEEFDKAFNVLKLSPDFLTQLRSEDPAVAMKALEQYRDGLVRQAMTMAEYRVQALIKEIRDNDLAPIQSFVSEQQATSFRNDFFKANPDLEKYESIVDAVAAKLSQAGVRGTRAEMMTHYATESKKIIDQLTAANAGATAGNGAGKTNTNGGHASTGRKMSTLTGGGQSTAAKGGGAVEAKGPPGIEVFD